MTEVPEHLLSRSKARRSAMGGGDADAPTASAPATTEDAAAPATPAQAAAPAVPATPEPPKPTPPWVTAAQSRKKIPVWAVPVLALLPIWAVVYALTLDPPTSETGPLVIGEEVYNGKGCSGCHGASGGGSGAIPALDNLTESFPRPADQVAWVAIGSAGWQQAGLDTLPGGAPVAGGMPAWDTSLTPEELMAVVLHERAAFSGEPFDAAVWEDGFEDTVRQLVPDQADDYIAVLDEWKADPPV